METYFQYLKEMIVSFFRNVGNWFVDRWGTPFRHLADYHREYVDIWQRYGSGGKFGGGGWFFFVLFAILFASLVLGLLYLIVWLIRKYVKFYKKEVDKEKLIQQVSDLNVALYNAQMENRRILGLQVASMGAENPQIPGPEEKNGEEEEPVAGQENLRFPRLSAVDRKYMSLDSRHTTLMKEADEALSLEQVCDRFRNYAASQHKLYYTIDTVRQFFAGMAASKLIILEGISGTGKTSLPYCMGCFLHNPAVICSVQPSFRDKTELIGYYNDFTKKFTETEFLRAVYEAGYRNDPNLIVLDEMNLARVEYYFAEFLSIMEMPHPEEWKIDVISSTAPGDPKNLIDGKLRIGQNLWFIGTANNDDSTFTISDKVYDRAISIFFANKGQPFTAPFTEEMPMTSDYLLGLFKNAMNDFPISSTTLAKWDELDDFVIANFKIAFGNRIQNQMKKFVPAYVACGGSELQGVDFIFASKILKKFEALNLAYLKDELFALDKKLTALFGRSEFKLSKERIQTLIKNNS